MESLSQDGNPRPTPGRVGCVIWTPPGVEIPPDLRCALHAKGVAFVREDHRFDALASWLEADRSQDPEAHAPAVLILIEPHSLPGARAVASAGRNFIHRSGVWVYDEQAPGRLRSVTPADLPRDGVSAPRIELPEGRTWDTPSPSGPRLAGADPRQEPTPEQAPTTPRPLPRLRLTGAEDTAPKKVLGPEPDPHAPSQAAQSHIGADHDNPANEDALISEEELRMLMEDPSIEPMREPPHGAAGSR